MPPVAAEREVTMQKEKFGVSKDGKEVSLYTLENSRGMKAVVTDFGAILVRLIVPDAEGNAPMW